MEKSRRQAQIEQSCLWCYQALLELMRQTPYSKIRIIDIAKRAGLTRQTIHRHFDSKEEILKWYTEKIFHQFLQVVEDKGLSNELNAKLAFRFFDENSEILSLLVKNNIEYLFLKRIEEFTSVICDRMCTKKDPVERFYTEKFFAGGFFLLTINWIKRGKKESPEDIQKLLASLIPWEG